ncbi:hypothetical protein [Variovorax saccharolyticus]|uniref:hypothetical protein n=1 Tax=Variovorax saccharolyticus TaxID=3053516 RepID=UPI002576C6AB|nr:hypothetical protein [Variovorax sp. J31P216]MDM0029469.1 hypothetical protein [Variovorax sp. J31P216]
MTPELERIRELKTSAKNQRDRGIKGYPRALASLREAIALGEEAVQAPLPELAARSAAELCDCFGLTGGIERRWADELEGEDRIAHLKLAVLAYDAGHGYESDPRYGISNSYNLVNRLIARLLLAPEALQADQPLALDGIAALHLATEFDRAAAVIREQVAGPRRGDYWAWADLAMIEVLLLRSAPEAAYAQFLGLGPPDFAYVSALAGLRPLAALDIGSASALKAAVDLLEAQLLRLRA